MNPARPPGPKGKECSSFRLPNLAWRCVCLSRHEELGHSIETAYALPQGIDIRNFHIIPCRAIPNSQKRRDVWSSTWSGVLAD